jgi:hypothetical protein
MKNMEEALETFQIEAEPPYLNENQLRDIVKSQINRF